MPALTPGRHTLESRSARRVTDLGPLCVYLSQRTKEKRQGLRLHTHAGESCKVLITLLSDKNAELYFNTSFLLEKGPKLRMCYNQILLKDEWQGSEIHSLIEELS